MSDSDGLQVLSHNWWGSTLFIIAAALALLWLIGRVPPEARFNEEYEWPREPERGDRRLLLAYLVVLAGAGIWVYWTQMPTALGDLGDFFADRGWHLAWSPQLLAASPFLLAELGFGALLLRWLWPPILAEVGWPIPDWLIEILVFLITIGTFLWELAGLPAGPIGIILTLLASYLIVMGTALLTWKSFPNSPLRNWFCTVLVPYFWEFPLWGWHLAWGCLKWAFVITYDAWSWVYEEYKEWIAWIPQWVEKKIYVKEPIRTWIVGPPSPQPKKWWQKLVDGVIDVVDTLIEVVEWVWVVIAVFVFELVAIVVYSIVTIVMWVVWMWVEIACLVFGVIVLSVSVFTILTIWIPWWWLRILLWN